jgi:hypothetical protein
MYYSIDKMSRSGFKWTINEILSLQREFELLGWNIDEIALKHERTPNAIMYKLDQEGFADYNVLYSNYHNLNAQIPLETPAKNTNTSTLSLNYDYISEVDDDSQIDDKMTDLSQRVNNLEKVVQGIQITLDKLMSNQNTTCKQNAACNQLLSKCRF